MFYFPLTQYFTKLNQNISLPWNSPWTKHKTSKQRNQKKVYEFSSPEPLAHGKLL